ncbi:HMG box [Dictyocaulus viviparus]|uniref:Protein pop-1 n=1 Tax=Dictyocaulus viviparus TaxID=29172 RepID=A0A0D8Y1N7_DICVI|nr:HMG box [Dictyocaulus viviparus]
MGMRAPMSPSFVPCVMPAALSPHNVEMYRQMMMMNGPCSPLYGSMAAAGMKMDVPLTASMRTSNPLNQMNQMRLPFVSSPITSMANNMTNDGLRRTRDGKVKKVSFLLQYMESVTNYSKSLYSIYIQMVRLLQEDHIKKPLNAFMWFMKENRPKLMEELGYKEKQSAELNKELGKRWHDLPKEEQQKYFDMARADREQHKAKYPGWSARENYAVHKRKKKRRDKSEDVTDMKKCRARFGIANTDQWCKFCKRKKKCMYSTYDPTDTLSEEHGDRTSSGPSPLTSSLGPSPLGGVADHDASDSESEVDEEDRTLVDMDIQEAAMQQQAITRDNELAAF